MKPASDIGIRAGGSHAQAAARDIHNHIAQTIIIVLGDAAKDAGMCPCALRALAAEAQCVAAKLERSQP